MPLAPVLLAVVDAPSIAPLDEYGSPILLFFFILVLLALACAAFAVAAIASGLLLAIVGAICIAIVVIASLALAAAAVNFALATIVWTRQPPVRRWMSPGWWGTLTLATGPVAAIPFWWLHYICKPDPRVRQIPVN